MDIIPKLISSALVQYWERIYKMVNALFEYTWLRMFYLHILFINYTDHIGAKPQVNLKHSSVWDIFMSECFRLILKQAAN